jgi:hypothetical protein
LSAALKQIMDCSFFDVLTNGKLVSTPQQAKEAFRASLISIFHRDDHNQLCPDAVICREMTLQKAISRK